MGRKPNTELRRQQIVSALFLEMADVGYERASTKSIAERAGLAPGLVHYHFKSKEEILLELLEQLIGQADLRYAELARTTTTPAQRLSAFVSARVGFGSDGESEQVRVWVNIIAEAMGQPSVRKRVARWFGANHKELTKLFTSVGADAPKEQASMLIAMMLGSFSLHTLGVTGVPKGYAGRQMLAWLRTVTGSSE
jgi:TetR/AcrR family transcriptional repressor of bet genes